MSIIKVLPISFRVKCEAIATSQRYRLRLRAFEPLHSNTLAKLLGATLFTPDELPSIDEVLRAEFVSKANWSAAIIQLTPLWILYNPTHSGSRHESNMMHEFAHVLLNHKLATMNRKHSPVPIVKAQAWSFFQR